MEKLLFLSHRIPYPPNKGDKIRSFNMLKHLSATHRVYLGTFIDDPHDWRYVDQLRAMCAEVFVLGINPTLKRLRSLTGLLTGRALSLPYFLDPRLYSWVRTTLDTQGINQVFTYSSPMAQYILDEDSRRLHRVADFVDVDSEKWKAYAAKHHWPVNLLYAREAKKLLQYEQRVATEFDHTVFVSDAELRVFRELVPSVFDRVSCIENGVDTEYFSWEADYPCPYEPQHKVLVFTGAMDYWANVDAVNWFARDIFPIVVEEVPQARFYIVGARPTQAVLELDNLPGVTVTGGVRDIRPYLAHATAAVAPLRIARGVQNKVLEAVAMGRTVLATPAALEGLSDGVSELQLVSSDAEGLARLAIQYLRSNSQSDIARMQRRSVIATYSWEEKLNCLDAYLVGAELRHQSSPGKSGSVEHLQEHA